MTSRPSVAISVPEFMAGFVAGVSGVVADRDIVQRKFTADYTYNVWNGKVMIVDRTYRPNFQSLPPHFKRDADRVRSLEAVPVVEKVEEAPGARPC